MKSLSAITMGLLLVTGLTVFGCSPQRRALSWPTKARVVI